MSDDRGTKKWTAMMMPEHEEMLRQMWGGQEHKEKPILDEQKKEEISARLQLAIYNNLTVEVKHYNGRDHLTNKDKLNRITPDNLLFNDGTIIKSQNILDVYID